MDAPENVGAGVCIFMLQDVIVMRSDFFFFLRLNQQQAFCTFGTDSIGIAFFFIPIV